MSDAWETGAARPVDGAGGRGVGSRGIGGCVVALIAGATFVLGLVLGGMGVLMLSAPDAFWEGFQEGLGESLGVPEGDSQDAPLHPDDVPALDLGPGLQAHVPEWERPAEAWGAKRTVYDDGSWFLRVDVGDYGDLVEAAGLVYEDRSRLGARDGFRRWRSDACGELEELLLEPPDECSEVPLPFEWGDEGVAHEARLDGECVGQSVVFRNGRRVVELLWIRACLTPDEQRELCVPRLEAALALPPSIWSTDGSGQGADGESDVEVHEAQATDEEVRLLEPRAELAIAGVEVDEAAEPHVSALEFGDGSRFVTHDLWGGEEGVTLSGILDVEADPADARSGFAGYREELCAVLDFPEGVACREVDPPRAAGGAGLDDAAAVELRTADGCVGQVLLVRRGRAILQLGWYGGCLDPPALRALLDTRLEALHGLGAGN